MKVLAPKATIAERIRIFELAHEIADKMQEGEAKQRHLEQMAKNYAIDSSPLIFSPAKDHG